MYNITKGLADAGAEMTLLAPITNKHDLTADQLPEAFRKLGKIHTQEINSDITFWGAFMNLFSNKPYYLSRYCNDAFKAKLTTILKAEKFEIILIESLKVSMYLPIIYQYSNAVVVLRSHNVEHKIWERLAHQARGFKKYFLNVMVRRLKKYEIATLNHFDAIAPITDLDGEFFRNNGCEIPLITTPSGIDFEQFKPDSSKIQANTLFHLGALDWLPNQEAIQWFLKDVWDKIYQEFPWLRLNVAGRNMPGSLMHMEYEGVNMIGEVENAHDFIKENEIMIVPLKSGSGMRIKVIEGMALGKCIISTSIGAEGIGYEKGKNILIADSPEEFLSCIRLLQTDKSLSQKIGQEAIKFAKEKYNNKDIIANLLKEIGQIEKNRKKSRKSCFGK